MKYDIHGDKLLITDAIRRYIEEKLSRLDKYFEKPSKITARIVLKVRGRSQIIEVTIPMNSFTLRNEVEHSDLYAAIDLVIDKLERQLVKNKTKMLSKSLKVKVVDFNLDNITGDDEEKKETVVKRKKLDTKPMSEEEAILQMNMLGHDFFIYRDDETNEVNVLYRRKDGNYGVIETK
jgi:putative sigma-54 modulation protein